MLTFFILSVPEELYTVFSIILFFAIPSSNFGFGYSQSKIFSVF